MPLDFSPKKADPRLKNLGLERDRHGKIIKYGIHFDAYDGDKLCTEYDDGGNSPDVYRFNYFKISADLREFKRTGNSAEYLKIVRHLARRDLFFLMYFVLDMPVNDPFLIARIYEAQNLHHYTLDCWARGHWKSTILSCGLAIWELLQNQNERICIFSHTKAMSKSHMRKIKLPLEENEILKNAFPEIFYDNPKTKAPKWSEDDGLYVMRKKGFAPGEASIEAQGLDTLPTGKHYSILIFDDIIDMKGVSTARQMDKALEQFEQADNLSIRNPVKRVIGTRYSKRDVYAEIMKRKSWVSRIYPGEVDESGKRKRGGIPVFLSEKELEEKREEQGEFTYSAQILQDPTAESRQNFKTHWLKYWDGPRPKQYLNKYIICDPARGQGASHDYTVILVIGTDAFRNYWLIDMIRDKLDLGERWAALRSMVQKHNATCVGYERYGMQVDDQYMKQMQEREHVFFSLIELGGNIPKIDRIRQLVPIFKSGRFIIPRSMPYSQVWDGRMVDLTYEFEEEYRNFPFGSNDDILDAMARILDLKLGVVFPATIELAPGDYRINNGDPLNLQGGNRKSIDWMAQ